MYMQIQISALVHSVKLILMGPQLIRLVGFKAGIKLYYKQEDNCNGIHNKLLQEELSIHSIYTLIYLSA